MKTRTLMAALAAAALAPTAALPHPGLPGHAHDLAAGLGHPLSGADHILAMVAVGVLAAQIGGSAMWRLPLAFVSMMIVGGALGAAGVGLPLVESGIALSVVALGLAVALRWKPTAIVGAAVVGLFALFHGHAHGAEMAAGADGLLYGAGFVASTALLHAAGLGLGLALRKLGASPMALRAAGAATAIAGAVLVGGVL